MKRKIQITIDEKIHDWFRIQAETLGVSVSGLINISMAEYRMQKETVGQLPQLMELLNSAMVTNAVKTPLIIDEKKQAKV